MRQTTLDLSEDTWREFAEQAQAFVKDYLEHVSEIPIFPQTPTEKFAESLTNKLPEEGASVDEIMEQCRAIQEASRHSGHPRFFGYVASSASPVGMIGDQLASALNQNLTAWRSSPAATDLERTVVRWLGSFVGFSDDAGGLLTSGGSMANLDALYVAHRVKSPGASSKGLWNAGNPMTVYASEQIHLSIPKAADVLGLGREQVRLIKTDERFRLDTKDLRDRIKLDIQNGFQPFALVASAGTVNTGAVDPLSEMAAIAREYDLWFHIDGAYGAPGAAVPAKREVFSGIELADSVSIDPHKWLYAPIDCGCLLLRDPERARLAFAHGDADYIKIYEESDREAFAFWDYGIELTRRFRALKVWMILQYYGASRLRETISEDISLAEYLAGRIVASEDFELLAPVELSICCFRYLPSNYRNAVKTATADEREKLNIELDTINEKLMNRVQRGGRAYLSSAVLNGRFALRVCIVNFRTTRADLDMTLDILRSEADVVET
jgi:glutamate/tyrosine decarboxylase-like PLP-dependent enzyme